MLSQQSRRIGLIVLFAVSGAAFAQVSDTPRLRWKQVSKVQPNGDIQLSADLTFSTQMYTQIKSMITNTAVLLREFGITGQADEIKDAKAEYDDNRHAVRISATVLGGMKNQGREWYAEILTPELYETVDQHAETLTLLAVNQLDTGVLVIGTVRAEFPPGTKNITFDAKRGGVFAEIPPPAPVQGGGTVDADMRLQVRPEIMSCLYKTYGNPKFTQLWVARSVFSNTGTATLQDYRVRFRLPEYSSWSPWNRCKNVYPGQSVVYAFYPILDHKVRNLTSETPATLEVEWQYKTPDGKLVEETDSRRLTILGLNEVIFSSLPAEECTTWFESFNYSPLIGASFVCSTDPIIQRFVGMAAEAAGGAGASISNENAVKFIKGVYDVICHNKIKYQSPPGLWNKGVRQHVKFGRDVLRNRAGTCIDLAILIASACQAGGLDSCLVMIPGHCFPAIKLPEGGMLPVEATMMSDNAPFEKAFLTGQKELAEAAQKGLFYLVDVAKLRKVGVSTPELPELPQSALKDWNIEPISSGGGRAGGQGQDGGERVVRRNDAPPRTDGGGDENDTRQAQANLKKVSDPNGVYSIGVPADWQVQQQGGAVMAAAASQRASVMAMAVPKQAESLEQFAQALIGTYSQQVPGWKQVGTRPMQVSGHPALLIRASGQPGGQSFVADYILVLTPQHQAVLMLQSIEEELPQWEPVFRQIVSSWRLGS